MTLASALKSFALGVATGGRSTAGLLAASWTTPPSAHGWAGRAGSPAGRGATALLAAGELYADKLEKTPSRLELPGAASRVVGAAGGSAVVAARDGENVPSSVGVALIGAGLGSLAGSRCRTFGADHGWSDLAVALAEDAVVIGLAVWAALPKPTPPAPVATGVATPTSTSPPSGPDVLDLGGEDPVDRS